MLHTARWLFAFPLLMPALVMETGTLTFVTPGTILRSSVHQALDIAHLLAFGKTDSCLLGKCDLAGGRRLTQKLAEGVVWGII